MTIRENVTIKVESYVDGGKKRKKVTASGATRRVSRVVHGQAYHPAVLKKAMDLWGMAGIDWKGSTFFVIKQKHEPKKKRW